jgi:hypothetical protein
MDIRSFTKPSTSSNSGCVGRVIVAPVRMLPFLPYDDSYLDGDADDKRIEGIVRNTVGFTRSGRR